MVLCGIKPLLFDEACLQIINNGEDLVHISGQTTECYQCNYSTLGDVYKGHIGNFVVPATHRFSFQAETWKKTLCNDQYSFGQGGIYKLEITNQCSDIFLKREPDDAYKPLWIEALIFVGMITIYFISLCLKNCEWFTNLYRPSYSRELENDLGSPSNSGDTSPLVQSEFIPNINRFKSRMKSLDVFRGITIALMVFVNSGGGDYWFFKHAPWNGLTVADIVFPWFAWIMGVSCVMSIRSQLRDRVPRRRIFWKCLLRTLTLFALGIILNSHSNNNIHHLRILGVLQRLGLSYFIVATVESAFMEPQNTNQIWGRFIVIQEVIASWLQWIIMLLLALLHFCITFYLPIEEGCPTGYLGPGGLHDYGKYMNCTGGAAGYIDRLVLGTNHLYKTPSSQKVYHSSVPYDPEGILGTLNTSFLVFLGAQAGKTVLYYSNTANKLKRWLTLSILSGLCAGLLCNFEKEGPIPINKNLWSLSFILAASSLALLTLSILLVIVDHTKWWNGTPFRQAGKNSILIYVGAELTKKMLPWNWNNLWNQSTHTESLIKSTWCTCVWLLIAAVLDKHEIYVSI